MKKDPSYYQGALIDPSVTNGANIVNSGLNIGVTYHVEWTKPIQELMTLVCLLTIKNNVVLRDVNILLYETQFVYFTTILVLNLTLILKCHK